MYIAGETELKRLQQLAASLNVAKVSAAILDDPRFPIWSGASKPETHHYGKHGLVWHVCEVVELCLLNNNYFGYNIDKKVDERFLFLAALFHDAGKMWDYEPVDSEYKDWRGTEHKRRVHHISRSALVWKQAASECGFEDVDDEILHAILAHHGQRAWGSPISPDTRTAWLLHLCDSISARMDDCYKRKL